MKFAYSFLFILSFSFFGPQSVAQEQIPSLSAEVERIYKTLELPGLAVVVIKDGKILHDQAIGYANVETKEELTTDHLFWTASVTKVFTAAGFLKGATEGNFNLDDPIIKFGPDRFFLPARTSKDITLRHLLTQTSEGENPGTNFVYSFRYNWLVSPHNGLDGFEEYQNSTLNNLFSIPNFVAGYHRVKDSTGVKIVMPHRYNQDEAQIKISPNDRWQRMLPATNLLASPKALALAGQVLNDGLGLPEEHAKLLNGEIGDDSIRDDKYGYGSFVSNIENKRIVWQYGFGGAESALFVRVPENGISIAVLSNAADLSGVTRSGSGDFLKRPLADALLRYVILEEQKNEKSPVFSDSVEEIEKQLSTRADDELDIHALLTHALINQLKPNPNIEFSKQILELTRNQFPDALKVESEPVFWLMVQHADPNYSEFIDAQLELVIHSNPNHPWFLGLAGEFYKSIGETEKATSYWKQNCNNKSFREHSNVSDACLELALIAEESDPNKAIDLAWKALDMSSWSFTWGRNQEARDLIKRILDN